ncbi:MAG: type II toxin-antitoxin system prevent-host-death family antitoxin [Burkholderiales bacterium]|jgi:antitoxin (DNA-binding transcriptional repressor) of toxin-antitoxin stability system|nr:type II toxin-antitoxin system prevent-host-death family antitoxin [Burkholderiales bacterium]
MTRVNVTELRQNLPSYLQRVRRGERVLVTSRGEVIAELSPPTADIDASAAARQRLAGSVVRYDAPFDPVIAPDEWEVER